MDRADHRFAPCRGARRDQGPFRSQGTDESGQDRAPVQAGRPDAVSLQARLRGPEVRRGARLERMERAGRREHGVRGGGRDVQQQRALPQVRHGHDVPVVPRNRR